jgi:hypothetical protein
MNVSLLGIDERLAAMQRQLEEQEAQRAREAAKYKLVDGFFLFVGPGVCPYPGLDCRENGHAELFRHGPAEPWASEVRSGLAYDEPLELPVRLDENGDAVPDFDRLEQMLAQAGIQVFSSDEEEESGAGGDQGSARNPQYRVGETPGLSWAPVTPSVRARWAPAPTEENTHRVTHEVDQC